MDVHESKKGLEKQSSTGETTRPPLVPADNKDGTTRRSRTREVSSRYKSPNAPKRCPSPNARRTSSISTAPVPKRAVSAERKRPCTPVRDTAVETLLAPRKTVGNKSLPESLWPSTKRSLSVSFQSDDSSVSVPIGKEERSVSQRKSTTERKGSPLKGKNSANQLQNSKPSGKMSTSLNKSDVINKMSITSPFTHSRTVAPSARRLSLDGTSKTLSSSDSRGSTPSGRRLSLDGASKSLSLSDSRTSTPSGRRLSLDGTSKSLSLSDSRMSTPSGRRFSLDGASKSLSLSDSRTSTPSGRRLSLDGASKSLSSSDSRGSTPTARRLSLDGTSKSLSISDSRASTPTGSRLSPSSRASTPSGRRLSLDGTSKSLNLSDSRASTPSGRRLSLDGTSKSLTLSDSRMSTPSRRRLSLDGTSKSLNLSDSRASAASGRRLSLDGTSKSLNLSDSRASTPSGRRLSLDGTSKTLNLSDSRASSPSGRRLSLDGTSKSLNLSDSRTSTPSGRRLSLDGTRKYDSRTGTPSGRRSSVDGKTKTSSLPDSTTSTPSGRRLSLDGTSKNSSDSSRMITTPSSRRLSLDGTSSKASQKSASDLLMLISCDDNGKEMYGSSFGDDSLRIRRPSSSSSSSSLLNGAARDWAKAIYPSSRGTSPVRVRHSSPSRQPENSTSFLSFIGDIKKCKKIEKNNIEDVHQLRLLYNRHLQWRYANAQSDAAFHSRKERAEGKLYRVSRIIADLCDSVKEKRSDIQQLRFKLKLYSAFDNQLSCLVEWASIESEHMNSLKWAIQDLEASTLRIPVTGGATVDVKTLRAAVYSAVDVMQAIGSSLCSTLAQVEERNHLVGELADVASHERAMLDECESLLSCTAALQVEEHSLRAHLLQQMG